MTIDRVARGDVKWLDIPLYSARQSIWLGILNYVLLNRPDNWCKFTTNAAPYSVELSWLIVISTDINRLFEQFMYYDINEKQKDNEKEMDIWNWNNL